MGWYWKLDQVSGDQWKWHCFYCLENVECQMWTVTRHRCECSQCSAGAVLIVSYHKTNTKVIQVRVENIFQQHEIIFLVQFISICLPNNTGWLHSISVYVIVYAKSWRDNWMDLGPHIVLWLQHYQSVLWHKWYSAPRGFLK